MCDVTTVMFVIVHTSVEIPGWVVTRLVTALKIHFPMRIIEKTRDAAHHQDQVTVKSARREMCDVTTAMFAIFHTCAEIRGWVTTRLVTALLMYFPMLTTSITRDAALHQVKDTVRSPMGEM